MMGSAHSVGERHLMARICWLRAAVLGANDGIVSTASLIIGVAAAGSGRGEILLAGAAALVAGAMSMAAGEYVSVSSQSDTEASDLARERTELEVDPEAELAELAEIYMARGLDRDTASKVAIQLTARDALGAHARDELGLSTLARARPVQAALASAATFTVGALLPLAIVVFAPRAGLIALVSVASLVFLALLGATGARIGGADMRRAAIRVTFWGALAMLLTAGIGRLVGTAI